MKKNTKIIATIGPSSSNDKVIESFLDVGVYAARFNFSHGDHKEQLDKVKLVRRIGKQRGVAFTIILDTKGPEIRTHNFDGKVMIEKGTFVKIYCNAEVLGNSTQFSVSLESFYKDVKPGNKILIDDGKLQLICENIYNKVVTAKALNSHVLTSRRGVNLPNSKLSLNFLSDKDKNDLRFGCENKFDWICASFVSNKENILEIRKFIKQYGGGNIRICAKIESEEALTNIKDIIEVSDAIMVARGDLGIEIPYYLVPYWSLRILQYCSEKNIPVIIATQMLETMISNISPTRAEVSDVYFASYFGADATMLSGESAKGNYPIETATVMARILKEENDNSFNSSAKTFTEYRPTIINGHEVADFIYYDAVVIKGNNYKLALLLSSLREKFLIIVVKDMEDFTNEYGFMFSVLPIYKTSKFKLIDERYIIDKVKEIYNIDLWTIKFIN